MNKIITPNPENHTSIVDNICLWWKENVHVLADFDKTLTKAFVRGESFPSLISILRNDKTILWEEYAEKAHALYNHYVKIEKDPALSTIDKIPFMTEWWRKHQALLVESGLTKQHIEMAVNSGYLEFREGIKDFISLLQEKKIPLVIISANGIGTDSIRMFFEKHNLMSNNISIISNELEFDEVWVTCWFKNRVIHSFNKSETVLEEFPEIHERIQNRKNVILMWDSLWDPDMINWFDYNNLLKVWFFNNRPDVSIEDEPELLEKFRELYDIVLHDDASLEYMKELLKKIS